MEGALSPSSPLKSRRGATEVAATTKSIVARRGRGGGATKKELRKANKSRLTNQDAGCAIFSLSVGVSAIIKVSKSRLVGPNISPFHHLYYLYLYLYVSIFSNYFYMSYYLCPKLNIYIFDHRFKKYMVHNTILIFLDSLLKWI